MQWLKLMHAKRSAIIILILSFSLLVYSYRVQIICHIILILTNLNELMPCRCLIKYCLRRQQQSSIDLREPLVVSSSSGEEEEEEQPQEPQTCDHDYDEEDKEKLSPIINTYDLDKKSIVKSQIIENKQGESSTSTIIDTLPLVLTDNMGRAQTNNSNQTKIVPVSNENLNNEQKLENHFPSSTVAERRRFLNAKAGKYDLAFEQMKHYMEWRERYNLDHVGVTSSSSSQEEDEDQEEWKSCASSDKTLDEIDWKFASDKALSYDHGHPDDLPSTLPQLVRILTIPGSNDHLRDVDGHRILHLLPAQMDPHVASHETFALCIAFYLERKLGRNTMEKMTVVIDVRAGHGWANPRPNKLIPFIKGISSLMEKNFPERLSKSILFPLPRAATVIWGVIKKFLDPNTAEKIVVLSGNAGTDAPPPFQKMELYMERRVIDRMEAIRIDSFL